MTTLVVYDSQFGNTQKVAEVVAKTLNGKLVNVQDFKSELLKGVSLLVVGCPIHGWRPSEPTTAFNRGNRGVIGDVIGDGPEKYY